MTPNTPNTSNRQQDVEREITIDDLLLIVDRQRERINKLNDEIESLALNIETAHSIIAVSIPIFHPYSEDALFVLRQIRSTLDGHHRVPRLPVDDDFAPPHRDLDQIPSF